ncbi:MAG: protein kinase domain-containing protein [Bacteriovoracaceae bacterium]
MTDVAVSSHRILRPLGQGALSEVFLAETSTGHQVALKILKSFLKNDPDIVDRLKKEGEILQKLKDERIVKFIQADLSPDGRPYIVQEYIDGKNLKELIERDQGIPYPVVGCLLISEVLLGLEEAHRHGIVHRDLKPENIMLTQDGRVKITDFGVAKNRLSPELTLPGMIIGTPAYMSLEQLRGDNVDDRSDIFSLGVFLYYFSTGQLPFKNQMARIDNQFIPPQKINPKIHPRLVEIIYKALETNADKRYQKAYEFRYELLRLISDISLLDFNRELKAYFANQDFVRDFSDERLIKTLLIRAKKSLDEGKKKEGILTLQQALTLDPEAVEAKKLLSNLNKKKKTFLLLLIPLLIVFTSFFLARKNEMVKEPEHKLTQVSKKIPMVSVPVKETPALEETKEVKKAPAIVTLAAPVRSTKIKFIIDNDIEVYLDGVKKTVGPTGLIKTTPGEHQLLLVKPGFNPIQSKIVAVENEVTTINTKGNAP